MACGNCFCHLAGEIIHVMPAEPPERHGGYGRVGFHFVDVSTESVDDTGRVAALKQ